MRRWLLLACLVLLARPLAARADAFERYVNPVLARAPGAEGVQEIKKVTPGLIADNDRVLSNITGALLMVKTNEGRNCKLLVQSARQKMSGKIVPILLIDRFVTFKEGEERTVQASGTNVHLYPGFHFNLDLGQVVPAELGGDLAFMADGRKVSAEPLGKARLYLITKPLPGTEPQKAAQLTVGDTFEARYFNGTYKLHDDGRRSGELQLKVGDDGAVTGDYYSDRDGRKYEVFGKVGNPKHAIQFTIKFPRAEQIFQGWLFTGDGKALTGSSRLQDREAGFYAIRIERQ